MNEYEMEPLTGMPFTGGTYFLSSRHKVIRDLFYKKEFLEKDFERQNIFFDDYADTEEDATQENRKRLDNYRKWMEETYPKHTGKGYDDNRTRGYAKYGPRVAQDFFSAIKIGKTFICEEGYFYKIICIELCRRTLSPYAVISILSPFNYEYISCGVLLNRERLKDAFRKIRDRIKNNQLMIGEYPKIYENEGRNDYFRQIAFILFYALLEHPNLLMFRPTEEF